MTIYRALPLFLHFFFFLYSWFRFIWKEMNSKKYIPIKIVKIKEPNWRSTNGYKLILEHILRGAFYGKKEFYISKIHSKWMLQMLEICIWCESVVFIGKMMFLMFISGAVDSSGWDVMIN